MIEKMDWDTVVESLQESAKEVLERKDNGALVVGAVLMYLALAFAKGARSSRERAARALERGNST